MLAWLAEFPECLLRSCRTRIIAVSSTGCARKDTSLLDSLRKGACSLFLIAFLIKRILSALSKKR